MSAIKKNGFSLVEVLLALGIISIAFIPALGLLGSGFSTLKDSNVDVKTALLAQQCLSEYQLKSFASVTSEDRFFDYEGKAATPVDHAISLRVDVASTPDSNLLASENLKRLTFVFSGPALQNRKKVYSSSISNMGN